jgi:peptidoglycan-N-acetylglucosamine deacetylase
MWSITSYDWSASATADRIERRVRRQITRDNHNVILLHDGGHQAFGADRGQTVVATRELIRRCNGEGYEFVTISEMLTG